MSASIPKAEHKRRSARLMKPFGIADDISTVPNQRSVKNASQPRALMVHAQPLITSKGRTMLALNAGAYLDYQQVMRLRNWLSDWLGHHREENS
jgi:hypothetical protein